jgi:alkylation response protein AidB-like acyl-CoA dehydrogenase
MNLEPTDSQVEIAAGVGEFLRGELPAARLMQVDHQPVETARAELGAIAAQGWIGATLPADVDGAEMSLTDEIMIAREAGRLLAPFGLLPGALAARLAFRAGDRELALSIVRGLRVVGLATPRGKAFDRSTPTGASAVAPGSASEPSAGDAPASATAPSAGDMPASAAAPRVGDVPASRVAAYGAHAGDLVLALTPTRAALFLVPPSSAADTSADPSVSMVWLDGKLESPVHEIQDDAALALWGEGITLGSAILCGIAEAARDLAIEHAKTRQQFGKPIGAFQAISHMCANIAVQCEAAWAQARYAAASAQEEHEAWVDEAAAAQVVASQAVFAAVRAAVQIHGALGATDELIVHRYLKRALVLDAALGRSRSAIDHLVAV